MLCGIKYIDALQTLEMLLLQNRNVSHNMGILLLWCKFDFKRKVEHSFGQPGMKIMGATRDKCALLFYGWALET